MKAAGGGVQVAKLKPRRLLHPDGEIVMLTGSPEPASEACDGLSVPSAADWRQVRLMLDLATGVLAADADALVTRLAPSPGRALDDTARTLATVADILRTWATIATEARERLSSIRAYASDLSTTEEN